MALSRLRNSVLVVRVPATIRRKLELDAELDNISVNAKICQILLRYFEWDTFMVDMGFVLMTKGFLRAVLDKLDDETIKLVAVTTCTATVRDAAIFMYGELDLDILIKTLNRWLGASNIPFRHIAENGKNRYIIQHDIGIKWNIYFSNLVDSLLRETGYHATNQIANDQTLSFKISRLEDTNVYT